jgi:hypothetical protein
MEKQWIEVYTVSGQLNAAMIVDLLRANGIEATSVQESAGVTYGLVMGTMGEARIYVPEDQKDAAVELLRQLDNGQLELPDSDSLFPDLPDDQTDSTSR